MSTKRFDVGQASEPNLLNQRFSFSGKVRGADVLLRLVEACGLDVLRQTLDNWQAATDAFAIAGALDALDAKDVEKPVKEKPAARRRKAKSTASSESY